MGKQVYTYAYGEAGAVQCGFCIPGMVLCSKALLDKNLNPSEDEIRYALRNNYCRCTGYVKIIAAVKLAADILRKGYLPEYATDWQIGTPVYRLDVEEKVLGYGRYPNDFHLPNMRFGGAVRSRYPMDVLTAISAQRHVKVRPSPSPMVWRRYRR